MTLISSVDLPSIIEGFLVYYSYFGVVDVYGNFYSDGFFYAKENNEVFGAPNKLNGFAGYFYVFYFSYSPFGEAITYLLGTFSASV